MKKHMPGFVPVNYKQVGKALLIIGLILLATVLTSNLTKWFSAPSYLIFFGLGLIIISLYLLFVVPEE